MKEKIKLIGGGTQPLICTPLVGKDKQSLLDELANVLQKRPDIIEWRADFFQDIANTQAVIDMALELKKFDENIPFIFTIRSVREGGQAIPLTDREAIELNAAICKNTEFEYVDCELSNKRVDIEYLRTIAHRNNAKIIASYHNFGCTPDKEILMEKINQTVDHHLDVGKIAVMPKSMEDVLTLLSVTLEAKNKFNIPLITMSMGGYGAITRMIGGVFGSNLSFAVGQSASAPGQIPIKDLRTVLEIVEQSMKGQLAFVNRNKLFVKRAWRVDRAELLPEIMEKAFALAESGHPGPVLVDVPMDVFSKEIDVALFERNGYPLHSCKIQKA